MPAGIPGSTLVQNQANPTLGQSVNFDLLSGPKGSPFDAKRPDYDGPAGPFVPDPLNVSTGGLSTGIGFGCPVIIGPTAPASVLAAGFNDNYTPGVTKPDGTASPNSTLMYIGGGKDVWTPTIGGDFSNGKSVPTPYVAGFGIGNAGNGGSRDAGAGPAFTGFLEKLVTATGTVANGAAVEAGWVNRSGKELVIGQSTFGSSAAASAAPA